ncbi:hypothetical protein SAMN05192574_101613 [Mucilaginibacter gossypiicola]|uniref:N-acetyltransferase domain-containing protein n=1 Tax=Mucilaginibacter gossypiicola TaxID=551995 RepID=A0A1H8ARU4_9SPHI|nr:hypothetical protein [Mucilaginibacter gossypiicola]SEM72684.1 hypothetical protein SAMN05192574_101613 [Mucilaginibacter gossypiicola]
MKVETKFVIGNKQGIDTLAFVAVATARQKFAEKISAQELDDYISTNFNQDVLMTELNSLSNQYLIVYLEGQPAGYARVTSKGMRPQIFDGKTLARIADFNILDEYNDEAVIKSLFEKCLSLTARQQATWINEYEFDPFLAFFEAYGFQRRNDIAVSKELVLTSVSLVKEN